MCTVYLLLYINTHTVYILKIYTCIYIIILYINIYIFFLNTCMGVYLYIHNKYTQYIHKLCEQKLTLDAINRD